MRVSFKAINGVDAVDVSLSKGLASVTMKPGNNVTLKQLNEAIAKNGFTMKQTGVVVRGEVVNDGGKFRLKVSGTTDVLNLTPVDSTVNLAPTVGKQMELTGTLPEASQGKLPDTLRVKTIQEAK